jgi:hypothetical protein
MTLDVSLDRASANAGIALAGVGQESPSTGWGEGLSSKVELYCDGINPIGLAYNNFLTYSKTFPGQQCACAGMTNFFLLVPH